MALKRDNIREGFALLFLKVQNYQEYYKLHQLFITECNFITHAIVITRRKAPISEPRGFLYI